MRESKPILTQEEMAEQIRWAKPILVKNKGGSGHLKVWNLKFKNKTAWQNHIVELQINDERVRINIADLKNALNFC